MGNRGKDLETSVNRCNLQYRKDKTAIIEKVPTPIELTKMGMVMKQSTVDYKGVVSPSGKGIAFDAKETKSKTSFPLSNIHQHQLVFLDYWQSVGGISFFLIHFTSIHEDKAYVAPLDFVYNYYKKGYIEETGRKSIPFNEFKAEWLTPIEDYLCLVKKIFAL